MDHQNHPTCTGCGRIFGLYSALTTHQRSCKKTNKRASDSLNKFQEIIESRKRRRLGDGDHADRTHDYWRTHQGAAELVPQTAQFGGLGLMEVCYSKPPKDILIYSSRHYHLATPTGPQTQKKARNAKLSNLYVFNL